MSEELERVWLVMEAIALSQPDLRMKEGVLLAQKVHAEIDWLRASGVSSPPVDEVGTASVYDPAAFAKWLGENAPDVCDFIRDGKLINAIKAARAITGAGLRDAKNACDHLSTHPHLMYKDIPF